MCLFTIFINNFPNTLLDLKTLLLVSTVVAAGSDFNTLRMELIHKIDGVFAWLLANKITINTDKTTTLIFSYRIFDVNYVNKLRLNSADIDYVFCLTQNLNLKTYREHMYKVILRLGYNFQG